MPLRHNRLCQFRRPSAALFIGFIAVACAEDRSPTGPGLDDEPPVIDQVAQRPAGPSEIYSSRIRTIDPARHALLSTADELAAGTYRYRVGSTPPVAIERDDYLVGEGEEEFIRLVLQSRTEGDELVLETAPALWSDIVSGGTYRVTIPFSPDAPAELADGTKFPALRLGPAVVPLLPLSTTFDTTDVCAWIADIANRALCGQPFLDQSFGAGVVVSIKGTVDSLLILGGEVSLDGDMDLDLSVDEGGFEGGVPPTFTPCNRAAYLGCLATPTGAAFFDWIRYYAPAIPDFSLKPNRVCIPGTPVRVRAGRWDYSFFIPLWIPPAFERCRIASLGVLPTIVLPHIESIRSVMRPHTKGHIILRTRGDGELGLRVAIPSVGYNAAYQLGSRAYAKAEIGLFVDAKFTMKNGGFTTRLEFDRVDSLLKIWTPSDGWTREHGAIKKDRSMQLLQLDNPDSLVARLGVVAAIGADLCVSIAKCDTSSTAADTGILQRLKIGANVGATVSGFGEATWTRTPVNVADPLSDNWTISQDFAYDLKLEAGVKIPSLGWILPDLPVLEWDETFECCRVPVSDLWGRGSILVETATTGENPDPDGYSLKVERADTLPAVIDAGALRLGKARDHGSPFEEPVPANGRTIIGNAANVPCTVWYTDALVAGNPVAGLALEGVRATGLEVPARAVTAFCSLLIARHTITLTGVAANCSVVGGAVRDIWLQQRNFSIGRTTNEVETHFDVVCGDPVPVGDVEVTIASPTAPALAADFELLVDGVSQGLLAPSSTRTFTGIAAGAHVVSLTGGPSNCVAPDGQDIVVVADGSVPVSFVADCVLPPGTVAVDATTTGDGADPNGYALFVDGVPAVPLPSNGLGVLFDVPPLTSSVLHVAGLSDNCRALGPTPFGVTTDAVGAALRIPFGIECTTAPISTVEGTVEAMAGETSSVLLRPDLGAAVTLVGPARDELAQLAGARVRVRGVAMGTALSVYGYEQAPADGSRRWMGIVAVRDGDVWLLGEDAVLLIGAPSAIAAHAGSLVWLSGVQEDGGVIAQLFGLVRVAP